MGAKLDWGNQSKESWEIAQNGKSIVFKISPDGTKEISISTGDKLDLNTEYDVKCEYNGVSMQIYVNGNQITTKAYQQGIFACNTDITIGAELYNNKPIAFAKMLLKNIEILNNIPKLTDSVFSAYDLFSSMGFNYTTTISGDGNMGSYKTLILPYDDITTQQMLIQLENSTQNYNTHNVVIVNTNGYGPLLNIFGTEKSETFSANKISAGNNSIAMQPTVEVPNLSLNTNTKNEAQYVSNNSSSPR